MPQKKATSKKTAPARSKNKKTPSRTSRPGVASKSESYFDENDELIHVGDKRYIDVNKIDYDQEKKKIYIMAILVPVVIALAVLWFVDLKKSVAESAKQISFSAIQNQIENSINDFKNTFEFQNGTSTSQLSADDLQKIKDEIVNKVKSSVDPSSWPVHESAALALSIQYPANWFQQDENNLIKLSNVSTTGGAQASSSADIVISQKTTPKNTKLSDWISKNFTSLSYKIASSTFSINKTSTVQFENINKEANQINSILFFQKNNKVYQVNIKSDDEQGNGFIIEQIIKSIKLL